MSTATPAAQFRLVTGADLPICKAAAAKVRHASRTNLMSGELRPDFSDLEWQEDIVDTALPNGSTESRTFTFAEYDIDNDGTKDFVLTIRSMLRSQDFETWYVFTREEFLAARSRNFHYEVLRDARGITSFKYPYLKYGVGLPYIFPWRFKRTNYVVLQDIYFGKGGSLIVGRVSGPVKGYAKGEAIPLELVCRLDA
jgi:hypothetical protein